MSKRDTAGHLLLVSGRKWTKTGVACPNSMIGQHCEMIVIDGGEEE